MLNEPLETPAYMAGGGKFLGIRPMAMILKMNFNFNFKDSLSVPDQSIRGLTTACDFNHTARMGA
jgi:hypothetical protein